MDQNMDSQNQGPQAPPPQENVPPAQQPSQSVELTQDSQNMGMLCHLLGLFTSFVGPLVLWLVKKEDDAFVDKQGKEALNFQITIVIAFIASVLLMVTIILIPVVFLLWLAMCICNLVFCIMAAVAASKGEDYRYPVSIRLIK